MQKFALGKMIAAEVMTAMIETLEKLATIERVQSETVIELLARRDRQAAILVSLNQDPSWNIRLHAPEAIRPAYDFTINDFAAE